MQRRRSFYHEGLRRWFEVEFVLCHNRNDRGVWEDFVVYWNPERPEAQRTMDVESFFAITDAASPRDIRAAHELHVEMARQGVRDHAGFASHAVGREIDHLRHLSIAERNAVREALYHPAATAA